MATLPWWLRLRSVAISAGLMGGENWASSASTTTSEAYHLVAEETGDLSVATVVLSTGATSVTQALQQAFQQVGFDPSLLHNSSSASTSDASNEKAAVVQARELSVNSDVASPSSSPLCKSRRNDNRQRGRARAIT